MKVAIVGSRKYPDEREVRVFVALLALEDPELVVISGGAKGVDTWAESEAQRCGVPIELYLPHWAMGKAAGLMRNREIAQVCDRMVAFWDGTSTGTKHAIFVASSEFKKPVEVRRPVLE